MSLNSISKPLLSLDLVPGKALGPFYLGMPIGEALQFMQEQNKIISHVNVKFSKERPLDVDLLLDQSDDGLLLRFEPRSQRLRLIEVYDVRRLRIMYCHAAFCAPDLPPTFVLIYERFGPSFPGKYHAPSDSYYLHYPGLSFTFPIPEHFVPLYSGANKDNELPLEFPDGTTPVTRRICIYHGESLYAPTLPPLHRGTLPTYFEEVVVTIGQRVFFPSRDGSQLNFSSGTQDVLATLGDPNRVFHKKEDKMRIHNLAASGRQTDQHCQDYFYNYFGLGMDLLFDGQHHLLKKIILHTNSPCHHDFGQYVKCNFRILLPPNAPGHGDEKLFIHPDSQWEEITQLLGSPGKPVVNNGGSAANPFGATLFYGYQGIVFEVLDNAQIADVCLFPRNH